MYPTRESNPRQENQNLLCYLYTSGTTKSLEIPTTAASSMPQHIFGTLLDGLPAPKVLGKALGTGIAVLHDRTEEFSTIAKCLLKPCVTKASLYLPLPELT